MGKHFVKLICISVSALVCCSSDSWPGLQGVVQGNPAASHPHPLDLLPHRQSPRDSPALHFDLPAILLGKDGHLP